MIVIFVFLFVLIKTQLPRVLWWKHLTLSSSNYADITINLIYQRVGQTNKKPMQNLNNSKYSKYTKGFQQRWASCFYWHGTLSVQVFTSEEMALSAQRLKDRSLRWLLTGCITDTTSCACTPQGLMLMELLKQSRCLEALLSQKASALLSGLSTTFSGQTRAMADIRFLLKTGAWCSTRNSCVGL